MIRPWHHIDAREQPAGSLLAPYVKMPGCYTDCFTTDLAGSISLSEFVTAFYTTWLFKAERAVLKLAVRRPSTDAEAASVAEGTLDTFAAWSVEARTGDELLMCAMDDKTRSWFKVEDRAGATRLYFGSAIVPGSAPSDAPPRIGWMFRALLGLHVFYSRALLSACRSRLASSHRSVTDAA